MLKCDLLKTWKEPNSAFLVSFFVKVPRLGLFVLLAGLEYGVLVE